MKLCTGDSVVIISGKDKGKKGSVLKVFTDTNRVIVSGVNIITRHIRKTAEQSGRIVKSEAPMHASKVMILDPKSGKPSRIGYSIDAKTGKKQRIAKASGSVIGRTKVEKPKVKPDDAKASKAEKTEETKPTGKKPRFWNKAGGFGKDASGSGKTESGSAKASPVHTRSAGRGS